MTANAPWVARYGHTSVSDAAGNIYVLGGTTSDTVYNDVWRSADEGEAAAPLRDACVRAHPAARVRACLCYI